MGNDAVDVGVAVGGVVGATVDVGLAAATTGVVAAERVGVGVKVGTGVNGRNVGV